MSIPNRNRQRGKATEKRIAKDLGGQRLGLFGGVDVVCQDAPWGIEIKSRKSCVVTGWMEQAVRNCPNGKTPLLVVHIAGKRYSGDFVVMRMSDWREWHG